MLTTTFIAQLLKVTPQTVINWLENGQLPFNRVGRGPRKVDESDLLKFLEERGIPLFALDPDKLKTIHKVVEERREMPDLPALVLVNREGIVISWNEGALRLFGIHPAEVLQRPLSVVPGRVEGSGKSLEHCVLTSWHAPFAEAQVVHALSKNKVLRTHLVISRFYGKTTFAGGFVLSFSLL